MQGGEGQGTDGLKDCRLEALRILELKGRDPGKQQRGKTFIDGVTFHHLSTRIQKNDMKENSHFLQRKKVSAAKSFWESGP